MKNLKVLKVILLFLSVICLFFLFGGIMLKSGIIPFPFNYESIDNIFKKDQMEIFAVSKYFEESDYQEIYIPSSMNRGIMSIEDGMHKNIQELEVVEAIEKLKAKGYSVIGKEKNTIYFQRWSDLDSAQGIAYSIDGNEPVLHSLIKCKPLSKAGWYYYEEDYDEWLLKNTTNGIPNYLLGEWTLQSAKTRGAGGIGKEYPINELYSDEAFKRGVKLIFNSDGTFIRTVGESSSGTSIVRGEYILRYENKVLLKHQDGTQLTVKYLPETQEIVCYTRDVHLNAINEYYKKR